MSSIFLVTFEDCGTHAILATRLTLNGAKAAADAENKRMAEAADFDPDGPLRWMPGHVPSDNEMFPVGLPQWSADANDDLTFFITQMEVTD